jgi:hypothetical protein
MAFSLFVAILNMKIEKNFWKHERSGCALVDVKGKYVHFSQTKDFGSRI